MTLSLPDLLTVPSVRRAAAERIGAELKPGRKVALSTHINAHGDGCGSEAAMAHLLAQRGLVVRLVSPTPWQSMFSFLLEGVDERSAAGASAIQDIDLLVVLDIND